MDTVVSLQAVGCEGAKAKLTSALRRATVTKLRDGEAGGTFAYRLNVVEIGRDEDGDPITTCVVEPVIEQPTSEDALTAGEREFLAAFKTVAHEGRASLRSVRGAFYEARGRATAEAKRKAFNRAKDALVRAERINIDPQEEWIVLPA